MSSPRELLGGISIFGGLSDSTLDFLHARLEPVHVPKGEYFFREGDSADCIFVLESGSAEVVKTREDRTFVFVTFKPGACFGETALMGITSQTAGIRAATGCRAFRLDRNVLHELYRRDLPQFTLIQMNLGREIARRFTILGEVLFEHSVANREGRPGALVEAIHGSMK